MFRIELHGEYNACVYTNTVVRMYAVRIHVLRTYLNTAQYVLSTGLASPHRSIGQRSAADVDHVI